MSEVENFMAGLEHEPDPQQEKDYNSIKELLLSGKKTKLTLELLYEAFGQLKSGEEMTISEACHNAMWEWDC